MKYQKALVTGGAGFIGSHLVEALLENGCAVNVIDDLSTGHFENLAFAKDQITFYQGDIRDARLLNKAAQGCGVVFHQAAVVSVLKTVENPIESARINDLGTLHVLEAARENGARKVVLASSCAVYGDAPVMPTSETMPPNPQSPYAVHKLTGEYYGRIYTALYGLNIVSLRYFNVYGPRQDPSSPYSGVISIFLTRALQGRAPVIYGDGTQYRDFVYVKDVVNANLCAAAVETASGNVYNVGTGRYVRILDLWEVIRNRLGLALDPEFGPPRDGDIRESLADVSRTAKDLGFVAGALFDTGIDQTLEWYMKNFPAS